MVSVNGTLHIDKKWDLAFLFENLQDLLDENNIEEARIFADNALSEAQIQENTEWAAKFQEVLNQLAQTRNLYEDRLEVSKNVVQVIQVKSDDLTDMKGIGPTIALKLKTNGFNTIKDIANSMPEQIARIPGIGVATASKMITNAKEFINGSEEHAFPINKNQQPIVPIENISQKRLESQSQKRNSPHKNLNEWFNTTNQEQNESEVVSNTFTEEKFGSPTAEITRIEEKPIEINEEKIVEEEHEEDDLSFVEEHEVKPLRHQVSNSYFPRRVNTETYEVQARSHINESQMEKVLIPLSKPVRAQETKVNGNREIEKAYKIDKNYIYQKIARTIKDQQFHEIPLNIHEMREFRRGIDNFGCKIITVSNNKRLIMLIPLKFLPSRNPLMVSEMKVLKPVGESESSSLQYIQDSIAEAHARQLKKVSDAMFDSFTNGGTLYNLISSYLGLDAIVQKGFKQKPLFMASGEVEYEIIIDPILVTNNSVFSIEKTIPFPYQKSSNLHIVKLERLEELMEYLEQKHALLATQDSSSNALVEQLKMKNIFYKNIKNYSLPFLVFGGLFSLFLLMQMGDLVRLFISLGFALIFIYGGAIMLVLYRYFQTSNEMTIDFKTPHHEKRVELPNEDLILINEEFSEEWMAQLEHEVNKKVDTLNKNKFTTFRIRKSTIEPKNEQDSMIDNEIQLDVETEFERDQDLNTLDDPVLSKYRSFLDD
ncbi:MAG: hypothetical protein KGD73_05675 [Candidatus Lokiarchaeota archaeon]|nr:hypothetical protein [Candidatus Lokiarchaeota archaeon]